MSKLPAFQFYPGDWLKDPALRRCSKAAKGAWIDMMCLMFECEDRGVLSTGGKPWTREEIAGAIGGDISANLACIEELLLKEVACLTKLGAISNRRMVRDEEQRADHRVRQSKYRKSLKINKSSDTDVTALSHLSSSSSSKQKPMPLVAFYSPPDWVPKDAWDAFVEMRKKIRAPLTQRAAEQTVRQLDELRKSGNDPGAVLDQSTQRSWRGVFEVKGAKPVMPRRSIVG